LPNLKIAILSYRSAPFGGGQGVYVHDISKALTERGHKVDIISGPPYPKVPEGVNLIKLPGLDLFQTFSFKERIKIFKNKKKKNILDYFEFCSVLLGGFPEMKTFGHRCHNYLIQNTDYDAVIDNQSLSYGMLEIQKIFPFIEIIHHPITKDYQHDLLANNKILYRFSRYRWYSFLNMQKRVAPKIKNIITPSSNSSQDIAKDFRCNESNITVIHNGLDVNIFVPYEDIKRDPLKLITTASADVPLKGLDYTLTALSILKNEFQNMNLTVIGKLKKDGHTSRLIERLGISDSIVFKTNLTKKEIAEEYAKSSVAIVSSLYEGFGYPVIEAMSCSTPLIAANTSSIPELIGNYATLIPPKDSTSLANSIKLIINNYDKYKSISNKGRDHIIKNFNWLKITDEYEDSIYKAIDEHNKC
tara:strand:- start:1681 stop:2928 length:1248 start_codon:yes stop_codon:yes gene_type:complete